MSPLQRPKPPAPAPLPLMSLARSMAVPSPRTQAGSGLPICSKRPPSRPQRRSVHPPLHLSARTPKVRREAGHRLAPRAGPRPGAGRRAECEGAGPLCGGRVALSPELREPTAAGRAAASGARRLLRERTGVNSGRNWLFRDGDFSCPTY